MIDKVGDTGAVGVRELRQNLSVYLRRILRGETLTVTERGRAVAELRPLPAGTRPLDRLIADARVMPPRRARPAPLALDLERPLSELLDEVRGDAV